MASRRRSSNRTVTGALTDLQRRVKYLQNKQTPTRLGSQSVVRSAIQPRAVNSDQIALDAVTNDQISADAVQREQIDVAAVGTTELDNLAVTNAKLGAFAVTTDKIGDEQVDNRVLGPLAVTNEKLQDAAVQERNMTPNSVANVSMQTDSVNFRTLDIDAVGNENMLGNSVGNAEMRDNAIGNSELQNNSISQGKLRSDSVGFGELQGSSVGNSTIQNGAVTDGKIGGTISGGKIGSGFNGGNIRNGTITGNKLASRTIGSNNIQTGAFGQIVSGGLDTGYGIIKSGNSIRVNTSQISTNAHRHFYDDLWFSEEGGFNSNRRRTDRASSSRKVKKNISSHKTVDPKKLLDLDLKKYKYKRNHSEYHQEANREWMHGYIVEELEEMGFSEVVTYDAEGNPEKLDYGLFSTLVLELVKVQQQEINYLQDRIKKLEEK